MMSFEISRFYLFPYAVEDCGMSDEQEADDGNVSPLTLSRNLSRTDNEDAHNVQDNKQAVVSLPAASTVTS